MNLPAYIEAHGDEKAAAIFGVKERTVASWRRGERWPRPATWREVVEKSGGKVTLSDLLAGPQPARAAA